MDPNRFDQLLKHAADPASRRGFGRRLLAAVLATGVAAPVVAGSAKKKKPCGPGTQRCGGKCVDPGTSQQHCGSCGNACSGGTLCCSGTCRDLVTDARNCGTCGTVCRIEDTCVNGGCKECPLPQISCRPPLAPAYCTDFFTDPQNCGGCGRACGVNEVCQRLVCACEGPACALPDGTTRCCPEANGICCPDGTCCPVGSTCTATGCCPTGTFSCGNGRCCPTGTTCAGTQCLVPRAAGRARRVRATPDARGH